MPWQKCNRMEGRPGFVARLLDVEIMAVVCREVGSSIPLLSRFAAARSSRKCPVDLARPVVERSPARSEQFGGLKPELLQKVTGTQSQTRSADYQRRQSADPP